MNKMTPKLRSNLHHTYMKLLSIALSLLLVASGSFAQTGGKVTGHLNDNAGGVLAAATISVLNARDSSLAVADFADDKGHFDIAVPDTGSYFMLFGMIGYEQKFTAQFHIAKGETHNGGSVMLQAVSSQLKAATVVYKKPLIEVKADKVIFNVESSINATGSNVMELLRKSPGVTVDNNENIAMRGKSGVKIYIDGKMSQLDSKDLAAYLKSINSNDVEAIEMISNPSAKYDAAGNAGVINIRLKKNKKYGTNGSTNINYIQGITPKTNGSLNLNYRNSKVNVFGNIGGNIGRQRNDLNLNRTQNDTTYIQRSTHYDDQRSMNLKAGIDYFIDSKSTIGFLLTTNVSDNSMNSVSNTNIYDGQGDFVKRLTAYNGIPGSRTNNNFNFNYRYIDTSGKTLNVDADYGLFRGRGSSLQPNNYLDNNNNPLYSIINSNYTPTNIDIYTVKADWEQNFAKGKLGIGAKVAYVKTDNTFDFYNIVNDLPVEVLNQSNRFRYTENVNAAYLNYIRPLSAKINLQAGVRIENTASKGELTRADGIVQPDDTVSKNYTDLFPSAALTWNINAKHTLNLSYSRRIDRPTYQDLNPFINKLDQLTYEKGNAFLRPQYTDNIGLTHTFMSFLNTNVSYSYVHDYSTQITDTTGNASYVQQRNIATQQIVSFSVGAPIPFTKWWNCYVNVDYNYQIFQGRIGANAVTAYIPSYDASVQQSFTLGKDFTAEISGSYSGPSIWGVTWHTKPQGGLDLGLQKQFWSKTASVKISLTDIFYTYPWYANSNFGGLNISGNGNWESRTARISFTYRFGNEQVSSSRYRKTGLESESNRIKGK